MKMTGFTLGREGFGSFAVVADFKGSIADGLQAVAASDIQIIKTCDELACGAVYDTSFLENRRQSSFLIVDFRVVSDDAQNVAVLMGQDAFLKAFAGRMKERGFDVSASWTKEPTAMNLGSSPAPSVDPLIIIAIMVPLSVILLISATFSYFQNIKTRQYKDRFETPFAFTSKGTDRQYGVCAPLARANCLQTESKLAFC
jgi:hypothetical protein